MVTLGIGLRFCFILPAKVVLPKHLHIEIHIVLYR